MSGTRHAPTGATQRHSNLLAVPMPSSVLDALQDGGEGIERRLPWLSTRTVLVVAVIAGATARVMWPSVGYLFTESLLLVVALLALGILWGRAALGFWAGFVVLDAVTVDPRRSGTIVGDSDMAVMLAFVASRLLVYYLLYLLVVRGPQLARTYAEVVSRTQVVARLPGQLGLGVVGVAYCATMAGLAFIWSQAAAVLVRPAYTWFNASPDVDAVEPVQTAGAVLALVALVVAAARFALDVRFEGVPMLVPAVVGLPDDRDAQLAPRDGVPLTSLRRRVRTALRRALLGTFLLAGLYSAWFDPLLTCVALLLLWLAFSGDRRLGLSPALWPVVALTAAYLINRVLLPAPGDTESLRPAMIGAILTIGLLAILAHGLPRTVRRPSAAVRVSAMVLPLALIAIYEVFVGAPMAVADNCGSYSDCWATAAAAAAAASAAGAAAAAGGGGWFGGDSRPPSSPCVV